VEFDVMLDAGYWILDTGYEILDTGFLILDAVSLPSGS
jgi:hypothetical protein